VYREGSAVKDEVFDEFRVKKDDLLTRLFSQAGGGRVAAARCAAAHTHARLEGV
jgi:hypothetical protein